MDVPYQVSVKINQLPSSTGNITLEVFVVQTDDCTDRVASDAEIKARTGDSHQFQYDYFNSPVEGKTHIRFRFGLWSILSHCKNHRSRWDYRRP